MSLQCCKQVYHGGYINPYHPCSNKPMYTVDGKTYCGMHYPPNVAEREQRKADKRAEQQAKARRIAPVARRITDAMADTLRDYLRLQTTDTDRDLLATRRDDLRTALAAYDKETTP